MCCIGFALDITMFRRCHLLRFYLLGIGLVLQVRRYIIANAMEEGSPCTVPVMMTRGLGLECYIFYNILNILQTS